MDLSWNKEQLDLKESLATFGATRLSQDVAERVRRMLGAIRELGPEHERVFKLLLEGFSQQNIARVEGRHPAAISRRVQNLREVCRLQLLA